MAFGGVTPAGQGLEGRYLSSIVGMNNGQTPGRAAHRYSLDADEPEEPTCQPGLHLSSPGRPRKYLLAIIHK